MFVPTELIFLLLLNLWTFDYSLAETTISCNGKNGLAPIPGAKVYFVEGVLNVTFDRDELSVYKYGNADAVNVLVRDVEIILQGRIRTSSQDKIVTTDTIKTIIEGSAVLTESSMLSICDLDLKAKHDSGSLAIVLQDNLFYLAKACVQQQLCKKVSSIGQDDFLRSQIALPHDFGDKSVLYNELGQQFPNMDLPHKDDESVGNRPLELQKTMNMIIDFLLASIVRQVSGKELGQIELPDLSQPLSAGPLSEGFLKLTQGTFGDLSKILRTENIAVTNDGLHFAVKLGLQIPGSQLQFKSYALKYLIFSRTGSASIDIDSITLRLRIAIDFNRTPCHTSVDYVHSRVEGVTFKLSGGGILDVVINKLVNTAFGVLARNVVGLIKLKLKEAINVPLESFNCERYRP